jgi:hypothetical protein
VLSSRPGRIQRVLPVDIPRPRSFGHNAHLADVAACVAELTDLLHATDAVAHLHTPTTTTRPDVARTATDVGA